MTDDQMELYTHLWLYKHYRMFCTCGHPWTHHRRGIGCLGHLNKLDVRSEDVCVCVENPFGPDSNRESCSDCGHSWKEHGLIAGCLHMPREVDWDTEYCACIINRPRD